MSNSSKQLPLNGHHLVPSEVEDHSVIVWRCVNCQEEYDCVSNYLGQVCPEQL